MRKRLARKRCTSRPRKRGWECRWPTRELLERIEAEREIREAERRDARMQRGVLPGVLWGA